MQATYNTQGLTRTKRSVGLHGVSTASRTHVVREHEWHAEYSVCTACDTSIVRQLQTCVYLVSVSTQHTDCEWRRLVENPCRLDGENSVESINRRSYESHCSGADSFLRSFRVSIIHLFLIPQTTVEQYSLYVSLRRLTALPNIRATAQLINARA